MNSWKEVAIPFAHPVYIRGILDCLNSLGVRPGAVLSDAGLAWQDLCDGEHMVDFSVFRQLVIHAIHCSGEPALGLIAGGMIQPYHTQVGIAAVTSENLGQSLELLGQYGRLIFGGFEFGLENGQRWSTLKARSIRPLCETHIFVVHSIVGAYCRLLEAILGRPANELVVGLPYPRPVNGELPVSNHVRVVEFGHQCLTFHLPVGLLHSVCPSANAGAFLVAMQACRKLALERSHGTFVQRVRQALLEQLTANPDVNDLAVNIGITSRTLARRLADAGVTYSDIKEDLRKTHAAWYLQHTELSIEAIASQLGYGDPTNFSRKFKHWYRTTPSKMRQRSRLDL
jgi:AraC-like DNA-binding protein